MKNSCPSCGAPLQLTNAISLYCVCAYCQSQVFRSETEIELLGKQAELPEDISPLQLYSEGEFMGKAFKVIGRCKLQWEDGSWNEWFLDFGTGSTGWLAEAQGKWILSFEQKDLIIPKQNEIKLGDSFLFNKIEYTYADLKNAVSCGFEGELPFKATKGEKRFSVDLNSKIPNKFLSFEYEEADSRAYLGQYVTLFQLKMKNMREFDGWKIN